jgi:hypothetical protein
MALQQETASKEVKSTKMPKVASYDIARADETLSLATDLAKFIRENKLTHNVQGKEYVNVEGWQYAGSRLGIVPIVDQVLDMSHDGEIKYNARVSLFDLRSQQTVGAGFAVCSNKENGKKFYAEYAIASMAQTRAIGKAYRNILAWIIRAAGYEPTPAEEMDYQTVPQMAAVPMEAPKAAPVAQPIMQASVNNEVPQVHETSTDVRYASAKQKEEIIRLLNNPVITRAEKTKMLLNINKLDDQRAQQSIDKLRQAISEREGEQRVAA